MSEMKKTQTGMRVVAQQSLRIGAPGETRIVAPLTPIDVPNDISEEALDDLLKRGLVSHEASREWQQNQTKDVSQNTQNDQINAESDTQILNAERIDVLIDAMADVNEDDFGKDGKPSVKALEALLGESISASERDSAWEKYQALLE